MQFPKLRAAAPANGGCSRWFANGFPLTLIVIVAILAALLTGQPVSAQTPSNDATLSALTVDGTSVAGFAADRTSYEFGVVHTTTQVTVLATPNDSGAMVGYAPTDADTTADGHQVDLSTGQNTVTIVVAAEDGVTSETYTLNVNRGTDAVFGWKAVDDFDGLIGAGNESPGGLWSDGTTMWVGANEDDELHAYDLSTKARDPDKDFDTLGAAGNERITAIWSDGTTMWVADSDDDKIYAYDLETKAYDSAKDFDTLSADNDFPVGLWSDGSTMWVADTRDDKLYAYDLETKAYDSAKDFDLHSDNGSAYVIWSDGITMWVTDASDRKIYAYNLSTKARDSAKDFNDLQAFNTGPRGMWSDGETMWVADSNSSRSKVYSYNMPKSNVATLSNITVDGRTPGSFDPDRASWEIGVAHDDSQVTVEPTTTQRFATVAITPADASDTIDGHQVDLTTGANAVTVTVTAQDTTTTVTYTLNINRGTDATFGWKAVDDFDTLIAAGNDSPSAIWGNGATMWFADTNDKKIYAYTVSTKARDAAQDFDTLDDAGNDTPVGIWSDGKTMWVMDLVDAKIYAYDMDTKARDSDKDLDAPDAAGNFDAKGMWSDGTTIWVADEDDDRIYAYDLSTDTRDTAKEFATLFDAGNLEASGIWSDGLTMWVSDTENQIFAYSMDTKARDTDKEFTTLGAAGNEFVGDIWSDGNTMWAIDRTDDKVYSYNMPKSDVATLSSLTVDGTGVAGLNADRTSYEFGLAHDVTQATVRYAATHKFATVAVVPADADGTAEGHQVNLTAGQNTVTLTVTAQDTTTTMDVTLNLNRGVNTDFGWKAVDDFDTIRTAPFNTDASGLWSNGTTMWVGDTSAEKLHAYNLFTKARDADEDFDTLSAAGNAIVYGLWSDGTTMWVADTEDDKIYAYNLSTKARDSAKDFDTLAGASNTAPGGLWSDGTTMWVVDTFDDKIYAYNLSTKARDAGKDFDTLAGAGNEEPTGIWSDETTMWVADNEDDKLYAYKMSDKSRDTDKDFDTLADAGNENPIGIWSDNLTMWVVGSSANKIYSYNMPRSSDNTLESLRVSPRNIIGFDRFREEYTVGVASTVRQATVTATPNHGSASVRITPADANAGASGHQVALSTGGNEVRIDGHRRGHDRQDLRRQHQPGQR